MAGRFDHGVSYYTSGEVTIQVHFPENDVSCQWCKFLRYDRGLDRYFCGLTDMMLYSKLNVPQYCPLEFPVPDNAEDAADTCSKKSTEYSADKETKPKKTRKKMTEETA